VTFYGKWIFFGNKHYGFIPGRSTVLQLLKIRDDWTLQLDSGTQVDIIYTDFEKAFYKVPHQRFGKINMCIMILRVTLLEPETYLSIRVH